MNVAIITSGYLPVPPTKGGAVENLIYNLMRANELQDMNRFTIYTINDDCTEKFEKSQIESIKVTMISRMLDMCLYNFAKYVLRKEHLISYRFFFQRMEFLKKVGKDILSKNFDRILLENNIVMFRAMEQGDNFKKYKGKIYYHAHNEIGKTLGYDKYLKNLTKVIGVSDFITNKYKMLLDCKKVSFQTVHNVIDEKMFVKEATLEECAVIKKRFGIDNGLTTILFTGRISSEKGILELIEALSKMSTCQYNLLIVGKTFFGVKIKDTFEIRLQEKTSKLKGNIVFTGYVDYKDMYMFYQLADICVLPSVWNEPCGLTIIECISSGTPLITTKTGGIPEVIVDSTILLDTNGLVVKLATVLEYYINNRDALEQFKKAAKIEKDHYGTMDEYYKKFMKAIDVV